LDEPTEGPLVAPLQKFSVLLERANNGPSNKAILRHTLPQEPLL
jgi:hypothetical protein